MKLNDNYIEQINKILKPKITRKEVVLDLFAGCGGLSLGFEAQGFKTKGMEMLKDCCETYNNNLVGDCEELMIHIDTHFPQVDILIGGPPCQPFSVRGKQKGLDDSRNGIPAFFSAVKKIQPEAWMFENVRGLMYKNMSYLEEVTEEAQNLGYHVQYKLFNTSHYNVPQTRERLVVVGTKLNHFQFPTPMNYLITAGDALGELAYESNEKSKYLTESMDQYIAKYEKSSHCITPRDLHLHKPARTLTCRNLSGSTSDMQRLKLPDGKRRRLEVREAARLQSFPDWFDFYGTETSCYNQIGNAVPPMFAYSLASSFKAYFEILESKGIDYIPSQVPIKFKSKVQLNIFET